VQIPVGGGLKKIVVRDCGRVKKILGEKKFLNEIR
jgi:hypothetical protein